MAFKTTLNYSPNFNSFKRGKKSIKFIIFHYTGMKKESSAINRLTNIQSMVSSHYVIKKSGEILTLVPDAYVSWHAGNSSWKEYKNLNENSIGIEITNPGHNFNYREYSKKQIISLMKLSKFLIKKYNINQKNILGHSDISPDRKKDPGERFPWKYLAKTKIGVWHTITNQILIKNRTIKVSKKEEKSLTKQPHNQQCIEEAKKPLKDLQEQIDPIQVELDLIEANDFGNENQQ